MSLIDMKWYALQVRPKWEEHASHSLSMKGYHIFSPTYISRKRRRGRVIEARVPIFPTYLFCRYQSTIRQRMIESPGVVRIVGFGDTPASVDDAEINSMQTLYYSCERAQPWHYIQDGTRVRITSGALKGVEGIFVRAKNSSRVVVNITLLQRSLMVEVDGDDLDPLTGSYAIALNAVPLL